MRAYKFPLYPTKEQQVLLWEHSYKLNKLYNRFIELEQRAYEESKKYVTQFELNNEIVRLKKQDPDHFTGIYSQVVQQVSARVNHAYQLFFHGVTTHQPHFRKSEYFFSMTYPQPNNGYKIHGDEITLFTYGNIRFHKYREIQGNIRTVSITHDDVCNKFYVVIVTDYKGVPTKYTGHHVGIDLGTANLVTTSDGEVIPGPHHQKYFDKQISKLKSRRDKLTSKTSRNYKFLTKVIHKLYDVKNHKTNDALHKISRDLSNRFDTIFVEDLKLKEMSETKIHARNADIRNSCMARFLLYLDYKCKRVTRVNPAYTSKTCCVCHHRIDKLPLSTREWTCPHCGVRLDRDRNAALNILHLGRAQDSKIYGLKKPTIDRLDVGIWCDDYVLSSTELMCN